MTTDTDGKTREAALRLRKYLAERARTPGIDFEVINGVQPAHATEPSTLLASDIGTVLDALGDDGAPEPGQPYQPGDGAMYLRGNEWKLGTVRSVVPKGDLYTVVLDLDDGEQITRDVDINGTGGGVAPIREH